MRNDVYCEKLNFMRRKKIILLFERENKGRAPNLTLVFLVYSIFMGIAFGFVSSALGKMISRTPSL